jgi:hypothetical protein
VADLERIQSGSWRGRQGRKLHKDGGVGESRAAGSESGELLKIQKVPPSTTVTVATNEGEVNDWESKGERVK